MARPANLEGTSLVPLLRRPRQPLKKAAFTVWPIAGYVERSARTKRWRYSEWQFKKADSIQVELYDLKADPWEQDNPANDSDHARKVERFSAVLKAGWNQARKPD